MNSEEKYLDELLKSMTESAPKERSMQDVMREMMGVEIPTPEPREQTPAEESVVVPDIISESAVEPVREDNSESNIEDVTDTNETVNDSLDTDVSEPTAEDLANLLDNIEMNFEMPSGQDSEADAISLADMEFSSAEIEPEEKDEAILPDVDLAAMLDDINLDSMIISEPVLEEPAVEETVVEEPIVEEAIVEEAIVEEPVSEVPIVDESIPEIPTIEESIVEEPVVEEPVVEEPVVEEPVVEEPVVEEPVVEEPVVEEPVIEEPVIEEPVIEAPAEEAVVEEPVAIPAPADPNAKMSDDDIAALIASMNGDSAPAEEPVENTVVEEAPAEEAVVEEPVAIPAPADPNAKMSDDDIAALIASMNGDSAPAEEPVEDTVVEEAPAEEPVEDTVVEEAPAEEAVVEEPVAIPVPADPNAKMSDDDIAALIASMNGDSAPAEEPVENTVVEEAPAEEPVVEETVVEEPVAEPAPIPAPADPNAKMSDDDIAALIASMNGDSAPAEEPVEDTVVEEAPAEEAVVEEPVAIPAPADPNAKMSDDDIAALIASMNGDSAPAEEPVEDTVVEEAPAEEPAIDEPVAAEADEEPIIEEPVSEEILVKEPIPESAGEDIPLEDDVLQAAPAEPSDLSNMDELSQDDMAAMLAELGLDDSSMENTETSESDSVENAGSEEPSAVDMLDNIGDSEEDLLALLEGIDDSPRDPENEPGMESDVTDSADTDSETSEDDSNKKKKKKKKKKGFKLPFFGKKNKEEQGAELQDEETEDPIDSEELFEVTDETESDLEEQAPENDKKSKKGKAKKTKEKENSPEEGKKIGFFAKILAFLSEEDEDEEEEPKEVSNDDIIAEVDAENAEAEATASKGKKGKKAKKDKKDKKGNAPAAEGTEGEEGGENANAKAKPKKEKKPKEPKEPKPKEPKVIVLSKPAAAALTFAVISVIAAVVFASILLPEYFDKQEGRKAYYAGDYMTTYRNLYSVSRNNSDEIMFKRAEMVVALDRRIDSYNARMALGQEVEALDSLIEGVCVYRRFSLDADITTIAILQQRENVMLDILGSKYGLSEKDAFELYELDEEEYTKRLYSIVYPDAVFEETTDPENDTIMNPEESGLQEENVGESEATETETNTESVENQEVEDNITQEVNIEDILPEEADMMGL